MTYLPPGADRKEWLTYMANIQIITDAASDLSKKEQQEYGIDVIPIKITADGKEYLSGVNMFSDEFYTVLENCDEIPKTSQPTTVEIYELFKKHIDAGKEILVIGLSSDASGTFNNMNLAKNMILEEKPDAVIEILDSRRFSYIYGWAAIEATKMAEEGMSVQEIKEQVMAFMNRFEVAIMPNSLTYLEKGGRINKASLIFGNMLDIVPVLTIKNGLIEAIGKVRGRKKLAKKLAGYIQEHAPDQSGKTMLVLNGRMEEETEELIGYLKEMYPGVTIKRGDVGPIIATHIGPVFAAFYEL